MSETKRMTAERLDWLNSQPQLRPQQQQEVLTELNAARASEVAKDKEIERLKAAEAHQAELLRLAGLSSSGKDATIREQREEIERLRTQVEELRRNRDSADADFTALS